MKYGACCIDSLLKNGILMFGYGIYKWNSDRSQMFGYGIWKWNFDRPQVRIIVIL
jgi:hypothetical protein